MRLARSFWSGIAAGCAFTVVSLLARALGSVPTLPELVQDRLVLLLPGQVFAFFLDRLLYLGKPLLFAAMLVAQIAAGGLAGLVSGRWGRPFLVAAALWLTVGFVLLPLAGQGVFAGDGAVALVTVCGFGVYALSFMLFAGSLQAHGTGARTEPERPSAPPPARFDRRRILAGGLLGLATAALAWRDLGHLAGFPSRDGEVASGGEPPPPNGVAAEMAAPGLPPPVTPPDKFYIVSKNLFDPQVNSRTWRLRIDGLVDHPLNLSYSDLVAMPAEQVYRTLECISNEVGGDLISNGAWTGVRLSDLLQRAGVHPEASALQFTSVDGYTASMALQQAQDPATLLAYRLGDRPLPATHGSPVRVLGAGTYGQKNPKWLNHIQLVRSSSPGFWQQQGWDERGIVQTMSQVFTPDDGTAVPAGPITISGIAFAGSRGIARVEVSMDGGTAWNEAKLLPSLGANTWTFWQYMWQPGQPGSYTIATRATDGTGTTQPQRRTDPFPAGATGYHQIRVRVTA